MTVSWYVPATRKMSDPTKHARLWWTLEPLIKNNVAGDINKTEFAKILKSTKEWAKEERIVSGVRVFHEYHTALEPALHELKGKKIVFLPGISIDRAKENPHYLGVDFACERNQLSQSVLETVRRLTESFNWSLHEQLYFISVAPVVLPFRVTQKNTLEHVLPHVVTNANQCVAERAASKGLSSACSMSLGDLLADPNKPCFRQGVYQFSASLWDATDAKQTYGYSINRDIALLQKNRLSAEGIEELIRLFKSEDSARAITPDKVDRMLEKATRFNRAIVAAAYARIIQETDLREVVCFIGRSAPEMDIMKRAARIVGVCIDDFGGGVMRNAKMSVLKEVDPAALRILEGKLLAWQREESMCVVQVAVLPQVRSVMPEWTIPKPCPELACVRCPFSDARREDTAHKHEIGYVPKVRNCMCDSAAGRFTLEDVRGVVSAKYGRISLVSAEHLYDELRPRWLHFRMGEKTQGGTAIEALVQDARERGYSFTAIQHDLGFLQSADGFVGRIGSRGSFLTRSFREMVGSGCVRPLIVPASRPEKYSIRASEFSSKCVIARILSKVDVTRVEEKTGVKIVPHIWGVVGTKRHELALMPPWTNYMGRGSKDVPVWNYTERELWTSVANPNREGDELPFVTVFGHADALLEVDGAAGRMPLILDYKRSPNEKPSFTAQELLYLRGVERALERPQGEGILVIVNNPFFAMSGEDRFPVYHFTYADVRSPGEIVFEDEFDASTGRSFRVEGLEELICSSYKRQHVALASKEAFLSAQEACHSPSGPCHNPNKNGCGHPFNSQLCNLMRELVEKGKDVRDYLLEGVVV